MMKQNAVLNFLEIIIGIVSPLGADKDSFINELKEQLKLSQFNNIEVISVTSELLKTSNNKKIPKSLSYGKLSFLSATRQ